MPKVHHGTYAYKFDKGPKREAMEDRSVVIVNPEGETLLLVCDGMGGANKGDLASHLALDAISESFKSKKPHRLQFLDKLWFTNALKNANSLIYDSAYKTPARKGMGTTAVAALISNGRLLVANVGDSRAYMLESGKLKRLTDDQTYVNYLIRTGKIAKEESETHPDRHVLMNAMGVHPSLSVTFTAMKYRGEPLLLVSDGIYNQVAEKEIAAILLTDQRADQKVASLILEANSSGGTDNCAVAYWESIDND